MNRCSWCNPNNPLYVKYHDDDKVTELLQNQGIIRNKLKIKASLSNTIIFKQTIYAYLQAIGVINSHDPGCFK